MRIIAVAMTKGGVGKTTTAVTLSHGLAIRGERVLLVDADTQGQCAKHLGVEYHLSLNEVLLEEAEVMDAVTHARENLDLLASDHHLTHAALEVARRDRDGHLALADALAPAAGYYDTVIIDAAPGVDAIAVNVLACADHVIAPVALAPAALAGVLDFVRHVERVSRHNAKLELSWILPTFHDQRTRTSGETLMQLRAHFGPKVCPAIRVCIELAEAFGWRQSIYEYAARSRGADDYKALIELVALAPAAV